MKQYTEPTHGTADDLSSKKHLPHRQHTDKPILKYDSGIAKPVQYSNHSDVTRVHSQRVSSPASSTKYKAPNRFLNPGSISSQRRVRNGSSGSVHSTSSSPGGEACSRPLSAKEVIRDYSQNHRFRPFQQYKGGAHPAISVVSSYSSSMLADDASNAGPPTSSSLQFHTFLPLAQKRDNKTVELSSDDQVDFSSQTVERGQYNPGKTHAHRMNFKVPGHSEMFAKTLQQTFPHASAGHPARTGLPPRPKDSKSKEGQYVSSGHDIRNPVHNGTDSDLNLSRRADGSENAGIVRQSRSEFTGSGRGTKPLNGYVSYNSPHTHSRVEPLAHSGDIGSLAGVDDSRLPLHNLTASSLLNTKMGTLRKMPSTKPIPGTLYLKRNFPEANKHVSKKMPFMLEHRPRGDGAPSRQTDIPMDEKSGTAAGANEMDEEDDDDISMPSEDRQPGDGEASIADELDDDDGIDDLYEDGQDIADDGNESDDYSVTSSLSQASSPTVLPDATSRPSTTQSARSPTIAALGDERAYSVARPLTSSGETMVEPALCRSLFPTIPPTINFISEGEKVEQLPWEIRKLLKWRMSPITPNVIKSVLRRSNFRITKKNNDWLGCFGKHMKATAFKSIREYQKLNHFPGSFQLGRKDRLWRNLSRMQVSFGKKEFGFFPQTYILPQDLKHLRRTWEDSNSRQKWIIKPPASARGIGIKVINRWTQIPRRRPVIVQKYLAKPLLINDSKFDMRVYVYVTSFDPLRVYIFEDGLARFASCKYSSSMKNLNNKFMHLTNYSINKHNTDYQTNTDDSVCQGHKWSLKSLWNYLMEQGMDTHTLWENIKDIIIKTLISADGSINTMIKSNCRCRYVTHELFGFDILLDEQLRPWILEVNISPSLHSSSPLDVSIKGQMVRDMMNLAGFRVPDKNDIVNNTHVSSAPPDLSAHIPSTDYCMDKRLFTNQLAADERAKHAYFCHKSQDEQVLQGILDILTPDDVRMLTESIDEDSRKGGFIRVFPTPTTKKYLRYFDQPRYYNLLLDQWVTRYHRMEQRGISILQSLCEDGIHLENPASNSSHQWCPPNSAAAQLSARDKIPTPLKKDVVAQNKSSVSVPRLPKVRSSLGDGQNTVTPTTITSSFSSLRTSPVPRATKSLDPTR